MELVTTRTRVLTLDDADAWRAVLPGSRSVMGSVEFARIREEQSGHPARLFVFEDGDTRVVKPFFLRSTRELPFVPEHGTDAWDIFSPEYTGPLAGAGTDVDTAERFRRRFANFCREERIVAEFGHLHPWHCDTRLLEPQGISFDREIVWVDLTLPEEELWRESFAHACRKNINRSRREGVRVFQAERPDDIREFYRVYLDTMKRNRADERYYFSEEYFLGFFERMPEHAAFFLAEHRDRIVAATLYLHDDTDVYSYLGGADREFQHVRPTNAVIYGLITWARSKGKRRLVLGGGYRPDDGIFRFKATFSPLRASFHVYRHVHLPEEYERFCRAWSGYHEVELPQTTYFPAYRAVPRGAEE